MSCFCHFVNNLISHCFMDRKKQVCLRAVSAHHLIFVSGNSINVRTVGDIEETEFSLSLYSSLFYLSLHVMPPLRLIKAPSIKQGEVPPQAGRVEWLMGLSLIQPQSKPKHIPLSTSGLLWVKTLKKTPKHQDQQKRILLVCCVRKTHLKFG